MRAAVALFGHAGIEWDFTQSSASEQEDLKRWIAFYKEQRDWLQRSKLVRVDDCDDAATLYGFISHDINRALFTYIQREPSKSSHPDSIRITGLDRDRKYRAKAVYPAGKPSTMSRVEGRSDEWCPLERYWTCRTDS
jgi:alpha-galactosidase